MVNLLTSQVKSDSKSFYAYVRSKSKSKIGVSTLIDSNGSTTDSPEEICELFNTYFATVFTAENVESIPDPETTFKFGVEQRLVDLTITSSKVEKLLDKLRIDKAIGADDMSPRFLYYIKPGIVQPLTIIFNQTIADGLVPDDWRKAYVSPIFKKGCRGMAENYRPISLTSQVCRLFETLMRDEIVRHLEDKCLLFDSQHGFRRGRSCLSNLLTFMDKATESIDAGENFDVAFLDFAKAFDKVPHKRLMKKLKCHGIDGKVLDWIENWLSGRQQRVCLDGARSQWRSVTSGVPQGSVLGPIVFLVYVNDIDVGIINLLLKFADDIKVLGKVQTLDEADAFQNDIRNIEQWSNKWLMPLQINKCKVMHLGKHNLEDGYAISSHILESTGKEKDLGVMLTDDLKPSYQCVQAYKKANKMLGIINRTISYRNSELLVKLYKSLVRPHVEYCTVA